MEERYIRNLPALTAEECALLRGKKVAVIGCGGLGGYITELLARLGLGALRLVDGDVFESSNLNRQLYSAPALLGRGKAESAADRVRYVNPDVSVESVSVFMNAENAAGLIRGCDIVLDALDSAESRRVLARACREEGIACVYGAISGWVAQAALCMPGDGLIEKLYYDGVDVKNKSVLSFTPALCAALQVSLCTRYLCGRPVESGVIYYFDLLDTEFERIPML